ncbi:MAG: hypothetical protein Q4A32_10660, partial [Lachnospiraceae bacterium]|nr:hypothetical protein [Lachnospiraceae bacterium]
IFQHIGLEIGTLIYDSILIFKIVIKMIQLMRRGKDLLRKRHGGINHDKDPAFPYKKCMHRNHHRQMENGTASSACPAGKHSFL